MARWLPVAGLFVLAGLAGCVAPPPGPTVINLRLATTPDVNAGPDGAGTPITLRVYQLAAGDRFANAGYLPLANADTAVLQADLVRRDDLVLPPAAIVREPLTPGPRVAVIAVFAGYRDFEHAQWRAMFDVLPNVTTTLRVTAGHDGLSLRAVPEPYQNSQSANR